MSWAMGTDVPCRRLSHPLPAPLPSAARDRSRSASLPPSARAGWTVLPAACWHGAMRIAVASDHAGFPLKQQVAEHLRQQGHDVADLGTTSTEPVDYPPLCAAAARAVVKGHAERGVVIGGSGQGEAIAANKVHGARAALCHDVTTARLARQHNDANVLSLGARLVAGALALEILDVFLTTAFEGGRHVPRLSQLADIEAEECGFGVGGSSP